MILLAIIALIVIPPDKLPDAARHLARFINDLKRNTSGIWDDIKKDAMLKPEDLVKPNPPDTQEPATAPTPPSPTKPTEPPGSDDKPL